MLFRLAASESAESKIISGANRGPETRYSFLFVCVCVLREVKTVRLQHKKLCPTNI